MLLICVSNPRKRGYGECVRIATWNLWWRFGDWESRQVAIRQTLEQVNADVICLQEVWSSETGDDQVKELAEHLNLHFVRTPERWWKGHSFGNAILSRYPIAESEAVRLPPVDSPGTRWALLAVLDRLGTRIPVICTHLEYRFDQSVRRQEQVKAIYQLVASNHDPEGHPVLLAGDFNATPNSTEIRMITGEAPTPVEGLALTDAWPQCNESPGWTWDKANPYLEDATWPQRRLDYVFVSWPRPAPMGNIAAAHLAGVEPVDGITASDHWAVVVDLVDGTNR
ncbi:MAG: endonuclease [Actinobacteria bacterium]|nr:endonuclease [Actinomycetota bacterium]